MFKYDLSYIIITSYLIYNYTLSSTCSQVPPSLKINDYRVTDLFRSDVRKFFYPSIDSPSSSISSNLARASLGTKIRVVGLYIMEGNSVHLLFASFYIPLSTRLSSREKRDSSVSFVCQFFFFFYNETIITLASHCRR